MPATFILADLSASMHGNLLAGVRDAYEEIHRVHTAIQPYRPLIAVVYRSQPHRTAQPAADLITQEAPSGASNLGRALQAIERHEFEGGLGFIVTDGLPTDDWRPALAERAHVGTWIAIGVGQSDTVFKLGCTETLLWREAPSLHTLISRYTQSTF